MISDQQRGLLRQSLPTGRLKAEVEPGQGVPDGLLRAHQFLVGAIERMLGSGGDALADQSLDSTFGSALGARGVSYDSRLVALSTVALVPSFPPPHGYR